MPVGKPITSVHVRRGDYLKHTDVYCLCDVDYYKKSMELVGDSFFIFISDDIDWCKEHFAPLIHLFKDISIKFSEGNDELTDLMLMKYCHHHIIANSSFSWWGAWLCINPEKKVIFPPKWFGPACNHDSKDLIF